MNERQLKILKFLIEEFVDSGNPVGSSKLLESEQFHFSGATLRNEMANLEEMGLLTHPHTSAGRTPTDKGYRLYVDELVDQKEAEKRALKTYEKQVAKVESREARSQLHRAVSVLAEATKNLAFATIPENKSTIFLGVTNVLRQAEFLEKPEIASQVLEVVEYKFQDLVKGLPQSAGVQIFIGEENLVADFVSCSMIYGSYKLPAGEGVLGILGPKRMDYGFNAEMIKCALNNLK